MKRKAFNLLVLLSILLGVAACGEKPVPGKVDGACQVLKSCVRSFPETPEIRQQIAEYCE